MGLNHLPSPLRRRRSNVELLVPEKRPNPNERLGLIKLYVLQTSTVKMVAEIGFEPTSSTL